MKFNESNLILSATECEGGFTKRYEIMENLPVVENLTSHDMPPNTPAIRVSLIHQPVMSKNLDVEIVNLKGGMMDMTNWLGK
jgi:hypothetical protein